MPEERPYSITTTGVVLEGFDLEQTVSGFATLFGVAPEKAAAYLVRRRLIRKDLSQSEAEDYRVRLNAIGVDVELYGRPIARTRDQRSSADTSDSIAGSDAADVDTCASAAATSDTPAGEAQLVLCRHASRSISAWVLPILFAIVFAFVWRFLALALGDEPGFFSWFVGVTIGLVAAAAGSRGTTAGAACAMLTVLAIVGGKGLVLSSDPADAFGLLAGDNDTIALRARLDEYANDARAFETIGRDDDAIRGFMIEHAYSEAAARQFVTAEELDAFRETTQPWLADYRPVAERSGTFDATSMVTSVASSFSIVGAGFLLLGAGTAFRLGSGSRGRA